jgi:hypothetical protein
LSSPRRANHARLWKRAVFLSYPKGQGCVAVKTRAISSDLNGKVRERERNHPPSLIAENPRLCQGDYPLAIWSLLSGGPFHGSCLPCLFMVQCRQGKGFRSGLTGGFKALAIGGRKARPYRRLANPFRRSVVYPRSRRGGGRAICRGDIAP